MIRSLRTGITGLKSNQLRLDVIGNNIAGVNTIGFKKSRVLFQDALAQRIATGGRMHGSNASNPSNVGYGVTVGAIDQVWSQGNFEYTNQPTDLALSGDGFFLAGTPQGPVMTRAGAFAFDSDGYLVTPGGLRAQGWMANEEGTLSTGGITDIRVDPSATSPATRTSDVAINGNFSADREINADEPLSMSTVIYDGTGRPHTLVLTIQKTNDAEWTLTGAEIEGDPPITLVDPADNTTWPAALTFDSEGVLTGGGTFALAGAFPDGSPLALDMDLSTVTQYSGSSTATVYEQNGSPAGDLIDYGFDQTGTLILAFSNGDRRDAAQLALGMVNNPDGLDTAGDGFYVTTAASGDLRIGRAGSEIPAGVIAGALESSNVDLAEEFTDMIIAQRGYQASARVVTTSDELLQETVSLKR